MYCFVKYPLIGLIAQIGDKSALLGSKHISGSTYIEVLHGNIKSASKFGECFDSLQPAPRIGSEQAHFRRKQVTISSAITAPYPAPELMQIAQTKFMGTINNDSIHIRDINAGLDDGSGNQYIVFIINKIDNNFLELLGRHLPVTNRYAAARHQSFDHCFNQVNILDAIIDKENLTISVHFYLNGFPDNIFIECMYFGLNRITVWRWCVDNRQIACPEQRKL